MKEWDAFALPSLHEGFSVALLEAMIAGVPVVASNVGGVPEVIQQGGNGLLVPPADPSALASSIRFLLENPAEAERMGAEARARAHEFTRTRTAERIVSVYERLLGIEPLLDSMRTSILTGRTTGASS
jgi:glycosyltransferase involved in cell wall biosynthesis